MMSARTISFDPQNTIRCQEMKGKNSLSHSIFSDKLCGNSVAADTMYTSYLLYNSESIFWLSFTTCAVRKKPGVNTYLRELGNASISDLPMISSIDFRRPVSLASQLINCSTVSHNTPSMSTAITCII